MKIRAQTNQKQQTENGKLKTVLKSETLNSELETLFQKWNITARSQETNPLIKKIIENYQELKLLEKNALKHLQEEAPDP